MWGIIPWDYANGKSPMGGLVLLEGCQLEVEVPAGTVADRSQRAAPHAVTDLIRRAIEVGRGRAGIQEAALNGRRHGRDGRPQLVDELGELDGGGG